MSLRKSFHLMLSCGFLCACFFSWLADRIRKLSGRKTDSLINMALLCERYNQYDSMEGAIWSGDTITPVLNKCDLVLP